MRNNFTETHSHESVGHSSVEEEINRCREHLIYFQSTMLPKDMAVNMKVLRSRFKIKTSTFPNASEALETFEKIAQRIILAKSPKRNWYEEDIVLLIWIVIKYCQKFGKDFTELVNNDWDALGKIIPLKDADACKFKWLSSEKVNVQQQPWSKEEDEAIVDIMRTNTKIKWIDVSKELHERTSASIFRTGKQCRERWVNHLDPNLNKGNWNNEEDITLVREYMAHGRRWAEIAKKMKGRTENAVKNRFNSILNKEKKRYKKMKSSGGGLPALPTKKDEQEKVLIKNFLSKMEEDKEMGRESVDSESEMNNSRDSFYDENMDEEGDLQSNNFSENSNTNDIKSKNFVARLSEESKSDATSHLIKLTNLSDSMKNNIDDSAKQQESGFSEGLGKEGEFSLGDSSMKIEVQSFGLQQPKLDNMVIHFPNNNQPTANGPYTNKLFNQGNLGSNVMGDSCGSTGSSPFNLGGVGTQFPGMTPSIINLLSMTNSQILGATPRSNLNAGNKIFFNQGNQQQGAGFQGVSLFQNINNMGQFPNLHNFNMQYPNINSSVNSNQSGMGNSAYSNYNYPGGMCMSGGMSMNNNSGQFNTGNMNGDSGIQMQEESLRLKGDSMKIGAGELQTPQNHQVGGVPLNIVLGSNSPRFTPFEGIYADPTFSLHPLVQKSLFSRGNKEHVDELSPKSPYSEEGLLTENSPKPYNPYGYERLDLKVKALNHIDPESDLGNLHWAMVNSKKNEIYFISAVMRSPNSSPMESVNNLPVSMSLNSMEHIKNIESIKARIIQPNFPWSVFSERSPSINLHYGGIQPTPTSINNNGTTKNSVSHDEFLSRGCSSGTSLEHTKRSPNVGFRRPNRGTTLDQIQENENSLMSSKKGKIIDETSPTNYLDLSSSNLSSKIKGLPNGV